MRNVLIVDDNILSIDGICKNIDWSSMNVQVCATLTSGKQVVEMLSSTDVDIIISDIRMPGMTGLEMAKEALRIKPSIKIILISAYDDFQYAKEAIRIGAFDYVEKPLDYHYLSSVVAKAISQIEQEEKLLAELNSNRIALEQKFFYDLLNYNPDEAKYQLLPDAQYLNICMTHSRYLCAIVQIQNATEVHNQFGVQHYHILIMDLIEDIKRRFTFCSMHYCIRIADKIVVVLGCNFEQDDILSQKVNNVFEDFCDSHKDSCLSFSIGIGNVVQSIWHIPISHINAKTAADYRFFFPDRYVFNICDIKRTNNSNIIFTDSTEEELIRLLCQKNVDGIKKFTESLSRELSSSGLDRSGVFAYIYSLLAKLLRFFHDIGITAQNIQDEIVSAFSNLSMFETNEQVCSWLFNICLLSCKCLQDSVEAHHNMICESVLKYIKQNYMDPDLCLNNISAYVNMSPNHLSAIFKKIKKQNITDVITAVRIEMAKTLLKTTNLPLKEISEKVGYANQYYFSACFKKRTGTTPSAYRGNESKSVV